MDTNTTSVDKALALGGDSKIQIGAQADPKKPAWETSQTDEAT